MKNLFFILLSFMMLTLLTSCTVVEGIFKAGMYWAYFLIALVIGVIIWMISKARK